MPLEFSPTRWAPRSAWSARQECAATPAPAAPSACQTCRQTIPLPEDGPRPGSKKGTTFGYCRPKHRFLQPFAGDRCDPKTDSVERPFNSDCFFDPLERIALQP